MDGAKNEWYFSNMNTPAHIPSFSLYGEEKGFPDVMHVERITDRAALHDWVISPHRHPAMHQVFLLLDGIIQASIDGKMLDFSKACILSIPRQSVHGFTFSKGTEGFVLSLPIQAHPHVFSPDTDLGRALVDPVTFEPDQAIINLFHQLEEEHKANSAFRLQMLQSLSQTLMVRIARNAERDHQKRGKSRHFEKLEALLTNHIKDRWSVAQYAAALSITSTQLSRITRAEAGVSASKLIDMWLFQEAQRSLAYTRMSVAEVGYTLGFEDPAYFSRAFRRHYGQSPSDYRQGLGISSDA